MIIYNVFEKLMMESTDEAVDYIKNIKGYRPVVTFEGWWLEAAHHITEKGLCLEFGVYRGESINFFSDYLKDRHWYGFDSFEGLQENWDAGIHGMKFFNLNGKPPTVNKNVTLYKGWFKDTLPNFFKNKKDKISFIHIDCDTYESTNDVLNNIPINRIQKGTVLLLDDYIGYWGWKDHVFKSFKEWIQKNKLKYKYQVFGSKSAQVVITEV